MIYLWSLIFQKLIIRFVFIPFQWMHASSPRQYHLRIQITSFEVFVWISLHVMPIPMMMLMMPLTTNSFVFWLLFRWIGARIKMRSCVDTFSLFSCRCQSIDRRTRECVCRCTWWEPWNGTPIDRMRDWQAHVRVLRANARCIRNDGPSIFDSKHKFKQFLIGNCVGTYCYRSSKLLELTERNLLFCHPATQWSFCWFDPNLLLENEFG